LAGDEEGDAEVCDAVIMRELFSKQLLRDSRLLKVKPDTFPRWILFI
jgi:hypothetical protein